MDEQEFKNTFATVNTAPCAFTKAILRHCARCSRSRRLFIAEREAVACASPRSRQRCKHLLEMFHHRFIFALRLTQPEGSLPYGKEIKVECGGLLGLQAALWPEAPRAPEVEDVNGLLDQAEQRCGSLDDLPYSEITKYVIAYPSRRRRSS